MNLWIYFLFDELSSDNGVVNEAWAFHESTLTHIQDIVESEFHSHVRPSVRSLDCSLLRPVVSSTARATVSLFDLALMQSAFLSDRPTQLGSTSQHV